MHFKLDENIPLQLINQIKVSGHTVSSVFSENISGINDNKLLKICSKNNYILITLDKDFVTSQKHKGIIILRLKQQGALAVSSAFELLRKTINLSQAKGQIIIVEEKHIRIRK